MKTILTLLMLLVASVAEAQTTRTDRLEFNTGTCLWSSGTGSPEGARLGSPCDYWIQTDTPFDLWRKYSGTGTNTGWLKVTTGAAAIIGGSGAATRLAYWSDASTLTSSAYLTYDGVTTGVGTATAAAGNTILNVAATNSITGSVIGSLMQGTTTGAWSIEAQQNGAGHAVFTARVLGAGDAYSLYSINGGQTWAVGLDNSDSDSFVISSGGTPGSSNRLAITTAGAVSIDGNVNIGGVDLGGTLDVWTGGTASPLSVQTNGVVSGGVVFNMAVGNAVTGNVDVFRGTGGTTGYLDALIQQSGAGQARFVTRTTSTGDALFVAEINGGQSWGMGLDNSDSDMFKISSGAALGTNDRMTILTGGGVTFGSTAAAGSYTETNSGVWFRDNAGGEIFRIWAGDPNTGNYASANLFAGYLSGDAASTANDSGSGFQNTGFGYKTLQVMSGVARANSAFGAAALDALLAGADYNTGVGVNALGLLTTGDRNTVIGVNTLNGITTTSQNVAVGFYSGTQKYGSGDWVTGLADSVYLGAYATASADSATNEIVVGYNAVGRGSNSVVLGNDSIQDTYLKGTVYADELNVKVFTADLEQALAGGQIITKSVAILYSDFTCPAASGVTTLYVEDLPSAADMNVFVSGDQVVIRSFSRAAGTLTIGNCVGVVTAPDTSPSGYQSWTFTRNAGADAGGMAGATVVSAGALALDYGTTGNGFYQVDAVDGAYGANSPYAQIVTWATSPILANQTVRARFGKLDGLTGGSGEFGMLAGTYAATNGQYFRASNSAFELHGIDLSLWDGATKTVSISRTAPSIALGNPLPTAYGTGAGVWMGKDTTYKFRVGDPAGGQMAWDGFTLKAAGWTIGATALYAGTDADYVALMSGGTNAIQVGDSTFADAEFSVTSAGAMKATSATITGSVTATSGAIGGCTIAASSITCGSTNNVAVMSSGDATYRFWAGNAAGASAPFSVELDGDVKMSTATVAGSVNVGTSGNIRSGATAWDNGTGIWMDYNGGSPRFRVGETGSGEQISWDGGELTLISGPITIDGTGLTTTGSLSAISADLGAITAGSLVVGSTNKIWINDGGDGVLAIGGSTKANAAFFVDADGTLLATSMSSAFLWDTGAGYASFQGAGLKVADLGGSGTMYVCTDNDGLLSPCSVPIPIELIRLREEVAELRMLLSQRKNQ